MRRLNDTITTTSSGSHQLQYTCAQMQGWRPEMEDAHVCGIDNLGDGNSLFAVFDGHGGGHVSRYLAEHFVEVLQSSENYQQGRYQLALEQVFERLDRSLLSQQVQSKLAQYQSHNPAQNRPTNVNPALLTGSTANILLITKSKVYIANCGDSRAAMYQSGTPGPIYTQLSHDHKPQSPTQEQRIRKAGGSVSNGRVNGNLSLSRAFGDYYYKLNKNLSFHEQLIISKPDITVLDRPMPPAEYNPQKQPHAFVVMGCDGIWQRFDSSSAGLLEVVRTNMQLGLCLEANARDLLGLLVSRDVVETKGRGCDNMSVVLIEFRQ